MKVILVKDIKGVGRKGDERQVADGYAGNYLIPRGLAVPAGAGAAKNAAESRKAEVSREKKARSAARRAAKTLRKEQLLFMERVTPAGKLYSGISARAVAERAESVTGEPVAGVGLERPIKEPGTFRVRINFDKDTVVDAVCVVRPLEEE